MRAHRVVQAIGLIGVLCTAASARALHAQQAITGMDSAAINTEAKGILATVDSLRGDSPTDYRTILALLQRADSLFTKIGSNVDLTVTLFQVAQAYGELDFPDSTLKPLTRMRSVARTVGSEYLELTALRFLGHALLSLHHPDSAAVLFAQAIPLMRPWGDRSNELPVYLGLGLSYQRLGRSDSALRYYRTALSAPTDSSTRDEEGQVYNSLGVLFEAIGEADSSLFYHRKALALRQAMGDGQLEARALQNIGVVFNNFGQPDSALAYHRAALPLERRAGDRQAEAATLLNIGEVFIVTGALDSALVYYRLALPIDREIGELAGEGKVLQDIGSIFREAGVPDSALAYFRQAMRVSRSAGDRVSEATGLDNIGLYFASRGELDSALASTRNALLINRALGDRARELLTLGQLGIVYRMRGELDSAMTYFEQSTILAAAVSKQTGNDFNQLHFNEVNGDVYALWARTWLDRVKLGDTSRAIGASLAVTERGRAQALLSLMGAPRELRPGADLPAEGYSLARRALDHAAAALVYSVAGDTVLTWLVLPGGVIHTVVDSVPHGRFDMLVAGLRYGVAQEDAISERGGRITRGGSQMLDPLDQNLLTPDLMAYAKADKGLRLRQELSALLFPPEITDFLPASGELLIIPQGGLGLLPFGLLPIGNDSTLLGDRFALRYGPSLTAIADAEARPGLAPGSDRAKQLAPALIVGDPAMPSPFALDGEHYSFDPLPSARLEGKAVADSLGASQWLTGAQASEAAVRAAIPDARLIHLATHGLVYSSDAHSRLSFVALAPDATHDGHLSVAKIIDSLTFRAELVVLSACQTAVGNVTSAEGTLGLQRAVLAKGARSVLVSLWNVPDESTLFLIERFYHHWLHDTNVPSKSEALRLAQADVRAEAARTAAHRDWADPFYWAAFQLVGAP